LEGIFMDRLKRRGEIHVCQSGAILEGTLGNALETVKELDRCQGCALLEGVFVDFGEGIR
jgi:hypothetical protein